MSFGQSRTEHGECWVLGRDLLDQRDELAVTPLLAADADHLGPVEAEGIGLAALRA